MESMSHRDNTKSRYFGNVKTRLGSKLPASVFQPPQFAKRPWETQPQENAASSQRQHQPIVCRPLNHIPHIRNPKLRQYYLQGTSWDLCNAIVTTEHADVSSNDGMSSRVNHMGSGVTREVCDGQLWEQCLPRDMAFGLSLKPATVFAAEQSKVCVTSLHITTQASHTLIPREQPPWSKGDSASAGLGPPDVKLDLDSGPTQEREVEADQSPSPEAEYDKLLDVEAVSLPDGQLCLLALPPECCQEEGPEALPYLKLVCRYITDGKGVVSGIMLVTSNKIFFDPCKTHPLVKEHGCEEYLLSCSIDNLASISFFSDSSNIHFNTSQQRRKGKQFTKKIKSAKSCLRSSEEQSHAALDFVMPAELAGLAISLTKDISEDEEVKSVDTAKVEQELDNSPLEVLSDAPAGGLGVVVLSSAATLCCRGQEVASAVKTDLLHATKAPKSAVKNSTSASQRSPGGSPGHLMFVRLRLQPSSGKKKAVGGFQFGSTKTSSRSDGWLAMLQESADKLYAYLKHCRPDLPILEEGEDEGALDPGEEEFVLIEDKKEDEERSFQRHCSSVDDWEMVLMEDSSGKPQAILDRDPEGLSHIVENSQILEASHVRELCKELPARTVGHTWQLAFSTSRHGASLKSLYRKVNATDSPMLIVIKDALNEIFGAFLSHPLKPSEAFYGTGETFLFMLHPRFKCFKWTGENSFFIKGDLDCFAIGGGSGHFGLWVDENLYLGHSSPCSTFNNCCLSETDDFRVLELEVWTFS